MHPTHKWIVEIAITNVLEDLEHIGVLKREDKNDLYHMFGNHCGLIGLLPRQLPPNSKGADDMSAVTNPNHQGFLIHKKQGAVPPKELIEKAVKEFPDCFVYLIIENGKVDPMYQEQGKVPPADEIIAVMQNAPQEATLYFGKADGGYNADSMPPHDLVTTDAGDVVVSCLLEGDLPNFGHEESKNSKEFFAINELISEKIKGIFAQEKDNLENVVRILKSPMFNREMSLMVLKPRGSMVIAVAHGDDGVFIPISENKDVLEGDGWWASRKLGDAEVADQPATPPKPMSAADKRRAILAAQKDGVAVTKSEEKKSPVTSAVAPSKTETADVKTSVSMARMIPIPSNYDLKKRALWIKDNIKMKVDQKTGEWLYPENWETAKGFPASMFKPGSPLLQQNKDLANLGELTKKAAESAATELHCIVGINQRQAIFKDLLDNIPNDKLWSAEQIKADAEVEPTWNNQIFLEKEGKSYPLIKVLFWPTHHYKKMGFTFGHANTNLLNSIRNLFFQLNEKQLKEMLRKVLEAEANKKNEEKVQAKTM